MNISDYGFKPEMMPDGAAGTPARITATHRERYEVACGNTTGFARLKTGEYFDKPDEMIPTTGDFVLLDWNDDGDSRILRTLPRRTFFSRLDPSSAGRREQLVAANFDYVFILQSLNGDFNLNRLERYLTLAWQSGAAPVVVLTKTDLAEEYPRMLADAARTAAGAEVYAVSAKTKEGLERLNRYLTPGKTLVFLGSSGVGKSSLVNALAQKEVMQTGEIREDDSKGRHTTTHRQLIMLPCGAMIIDTPGMRELGMWDVTDGLDRTFADVESFLGQCRFSDCSHTKEPGCAVLSAIGRGELSQERWDNYQRLKREAKYSDDKDGYLLEKNQKFKSIAKAVKSMQNTNGKNKER